MFVSMWMTRELITVDPTASLANIAATMARHRIRRLPVASPSPEGPRLLGLISYSDVLHAFPADINPFSVNAAQSVAALENASGRSRVYAADLMARDPLVTAPDAPIESAARLIASTCSMSTASRLPRSSACSTTSPNRSAAGGSWTPRS